MTTVRDPATTSLPSTPFFTPQSPELQARAMEKIGQIAGQIGDMAFSEMRDESLRQGAADGAAVIKYDDKGNVLPVASFDAPFMTGLAYAKAYREQGIATYRMAAGAEAQAKATELQAQFPTDPDGARAAYTAYITEKLANLDPKARPQMLAQFQAIGAGLVSGAFAARERADRATQLKEAEGNMNQLLLDMSKNAVTLDKLRNTDQASYDKNIEIYKKRWDDINTVLRANGYTPQQIEYNQTRAGVLIQAKIEGRRLYDYVLANGGEQNPTAMETAREQAKAFSRKHGAFEGDVRAALDAEISDAAANRASRDAAIRLTKSRDDARAGLANEADADILRSNPSGPAAEAAHQRMRQRRDAVLADATLNPEDRLRRLSIVSGVTPAITEAYGVAIAQHQATIQRPGASPQEVAFAQQQLEDIKAHPAYSSLPVSVQTGLQRSIDQVKNTPSVVDDAKFFQDLGGGTVSPPAAQMRYERFVKENKVGTGDQQYKPEWLAQQLSAGKAAWDKNETKRRLQTEALAIAAAGGVPNAAQQEAILEKETFNHPDGRSWDFRQPVDQQLALNYIKKNGATPEAVKKWFGSISDASSPEDRQAAATMFNSLFEMYYGNVRTGDAKYRTEIAQARLQDAIGQGGYLAGATLARGGPTAKIASDGGVPATPNRAAGDTPDNARTRITEQLTGIPRDILADRGWLTRGSDWVERRMYGLNPFMSDLDRNKLKLFKDDALRDALGPMLVNSGLKDAVLTADNVSFDPKALAYVTDYAANLLSINGAAHRKLGLDPYRQSAVDAIVAARDNLGVVRMPDGKFQIEFRPWTSEIRKATAMDMSEKDAINFAKARFIRDQRVADWVPGTEQIKSIMADNGSVRYEMIALNKDDSVVTISRDFQASDPEWQLQRLAVTHAIAKEMQNDQITGLLHFIPAASIFDKMIKDGKMESIMEAQSGNMPNGRWVSFLQDVRRIGGLTNDGRDQAWKELERPAAQDIIARHGGLAYVTGLNLDIGSRGFGGPVQPTERNIGTGQPIVRPPNLPAMGGDQMGPNLPKPPTSDDPRVPSAQELMKLGMPKR